MDICLSPSNILKRELKSIHRKDDVALIGNATCGIALSLIAAGIKNKFIAIPNNVCINVPMAVLYSDNEPLYLDVTEGDMGLDPQILEKYIDQVSAVIAVHAYGSPCQISRIKKICNNNEKLLIEDFCVAQGATINGEPVGSFGDISIVSFGSGKIIDAGHGGAILSNNIDLMTEIHFLIKNMTKYNLSDKKQLQKFSYYHTNLYNDHYGSSINQFHEAFIEQTMAIRINHFYKYNDDFTTIILESLSKLDGNLENRRKKSELLKRIFSEHALPCISLVDFYEGSVFWRFNLIIHKKRDDLLKYLLNKNYKISSWYPSVDYFFSDRKSFETKTPISDSVGNTILNIWVNDDVGNDYHNKISYEIINYLQY